MKVLLALMALALAAGVFWWTREAVPVALAPERQPAATPVAPPPAAGTPARARLPESSTTAPRERSVAVRVVDRDGRGVDGAAVRYRRRDTPLRELRTEAGGGAAWPIGEHLAEQWFVEAERGDDYARTTIDAPEPGDVTLLRLAPDLGFTVRVLEPDGTGAAGVRVAATGEVIGATDAHGELAVEHVQTWSARATEISVVAFDLEVPAVAVDLTQPPREPIVLRLPPTGRLRIEVQDAFGAVHPGFTAVAVRDAAAERAVPARAVVDHGVARLAHVPLGRRWTITATALGSGFSPLQQDAAGPRLAGEEAVVVLRTASGPVLTGRLLRDRAPLATTAAVVEISTPARALPFPHPITTDRDGRFRLPLPTAWTGRTVGLEVTARRGDEREAATLGPRALEPIVDDLGDLALLPEPVLVAGRLVGAGDLAAVSLWIESPTGELGAWTRASFAIERQADGGFCAFAPAPSAPLRLHVLSPAHLVVAPIPFAPGTRDLEIDLVRGGSLQASVALPVAPMFLGLAPRLTADDRAATLIADARWAPRGPTDGNGYNRAIPGSRTFRHGKVTEVVYLWNGLPPGRYHLAFFAWGTTQPIRELRDLEVPPDGTADDARLQHIELPSLRSVKLTVRSLATFDLQTNWPRPTVFYLDGDRVNPDECTGIDSGSVYLLAPRPLDLLVRADGFRDLILRGVYEDREVDLEPGPQLHLHVDHEGVELPPACALELELTARRDGEGPWVDSAAAGGSIGRYRETPRRTTTDHAGDAVLPVGRACTLDVTLFVRSGDQRQPVDVAPAVITVEATEDETVKLQVDTGSLRTALETLGR